MKYTLLPALLLVVVWTTSTSAEVLENQVGVGVNLLSTTRVVSYWDYWYGPSNPTEFTDLYLPIRFGGKTRIEPEVGLGVGFGHGDTDWAFRLRMGLFRTDRLGESFMSSFGIRAGIIHREDTFLSMALCLGGEHFFSSHLSLGGEARLDYCSLGYGYHSIVTDGLIILRWYVPVIR